MCQENSNFFNLPFHTTTTELSCVTFNELQQLITLHEAYTTSLVAVLLLVVLIVLCINLFPRHHRARYSRPRQRVLRNEQLGKALQLCAA